MTLDQRLDQRLKDQLEQAEIETVSDAFGGTKTLGKTKSYKVSAIGDWLLQQDLGGSDSLSELLTSVRVFIPDKLLEKIVYSLIRYSFLIELTNLKVGSTKMKTRWLPGYILMPQDNSFEPIGGVFQPGCDPRASSFEACFEIFVGCLAVLLQKLQSDGSVVSDLELLAKHTSFPYEFTFDYVDSYIKPSVHIVSNVQWVLNEDIRWLSRARPIIWPALDKRLKDKIKTKAFRTDRSLTGKDKTNRAKRWEVLSDDFQHASIVQCWSVERKLLTNLVGFNGFPGATKERLATAGLLDTITTTVCPVTLAPLLFSTFENAVVHGRSEYQVGHLHPLKRGGKHNGENVCWQSADGNRIQGDLSIEETVALLIQSAAKHLEQGS